MQLKTIYGEISQLDRRSTNGCQNMYRKYNLCRFQVQTKFSENEILVLNTSTTAQK